MYSKSYINIAIIKYWCKDHFNPYLVPLVPSISLLSNTLYTKTKITKSDKDSFYLNDELQNEFEKNKIFEFIDKVIKDRKECIEIRSYNNMPTAAGLASSSSAYSALTLELNRYFKLNYDKEKLAKISSMGSGSSCRSFYNICAFDEKGEVYELKSDLEFRMSALIISKEKKAISSRLAMEITKNTSSLLSKFVKCNKEYFSQMKTALKDNDFDTIGSLMQKSTDLMHETMRNSNPSIDYLTDESRRCIDYIKSLNDMGHKVYYTLDAGPNVKVLYLKSDEKIIKKLLSEFYKGDIIDVI